MARSREEVISEMVDSGLFSDDEIREAAKVAPSSSGGGRNAGTMVKDALELLPVPIPTSVDAAKRLMTPMPGKYGPSKALQEIGESFPPVQELVGDAATKLSESEIGQKFPTATAATGAGAYALSHLLPQKLTPSEAALNLGAEGVGLAVKAAQPLVNSIGRGTARMAEGVSGLEYKTPGVLNKAANDSSLLFGPGKDDVNKFYETIMDGGSVRESFSRASNPQQIIDEGLRAIDDGTLTPQEALVARQAVDKVKKTLPAYSFNKMRDMFDSVAKKVTKRADEAFSRAVESEALRLPLPINKTGGTSIAKGFLAGLGGFLPLIPMSPAVQGAAATAAGIAGRQVFGSQIPGLRGALMEALKNRGARKSNGS